ncbi:hypothetical protein [Novosphingobium cyanobacteriorum]|uniref:Uncharacterized protein n=1 Tax=Novosphingobium cyanobacteriorum TaxID=3024215 RepID=A0ABT6CHG0_9SPHN|nr:hypothetical protein [Novosphingobium cyanobacteriorum]MDF8333366.1 hypothetical protein [Novosphingobium cyanobacteriorum]
MASFADAKGRFPDVMVRYLRLFDRHVAEGRLVRMDHFSEETGTPAYITHWILFALPGHEWRMQAMIDLMTGKEPWSPALERRQGELLGYTDAMNDYWLEFVYGKSAV